ncbi:MAG: ATP-binding protein [Anaerolineaceae bacterium]|nr:ATP-binding protein [Anaerolineaceae bacterium]
MDPRYERLYAYLQDDITKKRPSIDLILNLLCDSFASKIAHRNHFHSKAPLVARNILTLFDDPSVPEPTFLSKYLRIDERVVSYLLNSDDMDKRLLPHVHLIQCVNQPGDLQIPIGLTEIQERIDRLAYHHEQNGSGLTLYLQGPYGAGKRAIAEHLCRNLGKNLIILKMDSLLMVDDLFESILTLAMREALLQKAILYVDGFELLLADDRNHLFTTLIKVIEEQGGVCFLSGNKTWEPEDNLHEIAFIRIEFPALTSLDRANIWEHMLEGTLIPGTEAGVMGVANKFRFNTGQITDAITTARNLARWRDPENPLIALEDLYQACRLQSSRKLEKLARKIRPHYQWGDIVLPADRLEQLREICNYVKYRSQVYDIWGFDQKLSMGKGLNALFAGPSGTGKTMAADIMAGELGLDLYKIDLSTVVSKYIGETEKNLASIFREAETSNAILFFDEADALFGKRSEVRDSHDRYANIEISYLLQKMEEYQGVVILASNLRKNMDDAFVRRMHFTVEFPLPSQRDRGHIWQKIWPQETPRDAAINLDFMAQRFEVSGGNIRNIALAAAFLAAQDGGVVNMEHVLQATRREYQKMGKVMLAEEFENHTV